MGRSRGWPSWLALGGLVAALLVATTSSTLADYEGAGVLRVSGEDRYETAVAISYEQSWQADGLAFLATGESFADALGVGPAAAGVGPVLLTQRGRLPDATRERLSNLRLGTLVVVGGPAAISEAVVADAAQYAAQTLVVAGTDRYDTSAALASVFDPVPTVFLASGTSFPDALSGGALAGTYGVPVLLVPPSGGATPSVQDELCRLAPARTYVLGGTVAVGDDTIAATRCLGEVVRLQGEDRYITSSRISRINEYSDQVVLATGTGFADGLAGVGLAAVNGAPLLLVSRDEVSREVACEVRRLEPGLIRVLGGPNAVSEKVVDELRDASRLPDAADCPAEPTTTRYLPLDGGTDLGEVAIAADGDTAVVGHRNPPGVTRLDVAARTVVHQSNQGGVEPSRLDLLPDGRVVVADRQNRRISVVAADGSRDEIIDLSPATEQGELAEDVVALGEGRFIVTTRRDDGPGSVLLVRPQPEPDPTPSPSPTETEEPPLIPFPPIGGSEEPTDEPTAPPDEFERVVRLGDINGPSRLTRAGDRSAAYAMEETTGRVVRVEPSGDGAELTDTNTSAPAADIAVDRTGRTWLLNHDQRWIDGVFDSQVRDAERFGEVEASALSPDGRTAYLRAGSAIVTIDFELGEVVGASFVPRVPSPDRIHLAVSEDGARAVLTAGSGVWVVDGFDQERTTDSGDARRRSTAARLSLVPVRSMRADRARARRMSIVHLGGLHRP